MPSEFDSNSKEISFSVIDFMVASPALPLIIPASKVSPVFLFYFCNIWVALESFMQSGSLISSGEKSTIFIA